MLDRHCIRCGKYFQIREYRLKQGLRQGLYCSKSCASSARTKANDVVVGPIYSILITSRGDRITISTHQLERVSRYCWSVDSLGYPVARVRGSGCNKKIRLHRLLLTVPKGKMVDHKNNDKLDNRDENIRVCSHQENTFNSRARAKSGYCGVVERVRKTRTSYQSRIMHNGKTILLGTYDNAESAARAYDTAAIRIFGEFAKTNFPAT